MYTDSRRSINPCISGEVSCGKSTLINGVLEKNILPVQQLHTTKYLWRIRNDHTIRIELKTEDEAILGCYNFSTEDEVIDFLKDHPDIGDGFRKKCAFVDFYCQLPLLQVSPIVILLISCISSCNCLTNHLLTCDKEHE